MRRGSVVIATAPGFGSKPRPYVLLQADAYLELGTKLLVPLTSRLSEPPLPFRPQILPTGENGLLEVSEAMMNVPVATRTEKVHQEIGHISAEDLAQIESALLLFMGFAR